MSVLGLALRSLRFRARGFVASFLALFLGATILMSFASLLDTRVGVSGPASTTLLIMACVVGGWGLVIVLYSTLAMLALLARQRASEADTCHSGGDGVTVLEVEFAVGVGR